MGSDDLVSLELENGWPKVVNLFSVEKKKGGRAYNIKKVFRTLFRSRQRVHFGGLWEVGVRLTPPTTLLRLVSIELHAEQMN